MYYFDWRNWRKMVALAWRERNPRNRRGLLFTLLVVVPAAASLHAVCFLLDPLVFPALRRTRITAPVFILGHARSGTTLLHRLMSRDPGRFSAFRLWELFFPSLIEKRAVLALVALDARWLGGALARRVRAWEERRFGKTRHLHPMGLNEPEEDDGVLTHSCASGAWIVRFPYLGELDFYHLDERPERERRRLMRFYAECVRRELCSNGGERIHLSKNPIFAGRVESLLETFPDARFVVPFRNPFETIPSLLKLMKVAWRMRHWSEDEMLRSLRILAEQSYHTYRYPLEVLARHPGVPHAIVDYAELVAEPRKVIERVYTELGLPMTPAYAEILVDEERRAREHETSHRYDLAEFGLSAEAIRRELAPLFERFHWDAAPADRSGARGGAS